LAAFSKFSPKFPELGNVNFSGRIRVQNKQNVNKTQETPTPPKLMKLCRLEQTLQMWVSERFPSPLQGKYRLTFVQRYLVVNNVAIAQFKGTVA
jgi:hypothetical protein